jgi:hypothetical protein
MSNYKNIEMNRFLDDLYALVIGLSGGCVALAIVSNLGMALFVTALMSFFSVIGKEAGYIIVRKYKLFKSKKVKK